MLPLLTAMLPKIRLNPENYHEFRAAMLMCSVGVNRDVVDRFMPEKGMMILQQWQGHIIMLFRLTLGWEL